MRGAAWFLAAVLAVGIVTAIAFGAYEAGRHYRGNDTSVVRIEPAQTSNGQPVEVVHIVEPGFGHGWSFFPGFFFFPLIFFALFLCFVVFRGGAGRRYWRRGGWEAEEWHRRQHEAPGQTGGPQAG